MEKIRAHYLTGSTLTGYPLALLTRPESWGDAVATDGSLPVAQGVALYLIGGHTCGVCENGPAAFLVENGEGVDRYCAVCLVGDPCQGADSPFGNVLGLVPVAMVEGVEA